MFRGGTIWTGTDGSTTNALTVVDGVIEAIGEQAQRVAGQHGRVAEVDLDGGFLMPSFGDGHAHPLLGGGGGQAGLFADVGVGHPTVPGEQRKDGLVQLFHALIVPVFVRGPTTCSGFTPLDAP